MDIHKRIRSTFLSVVILVILLLPSQYLMISKPIYFGYDVQVHIRRIEQYHRAILLGQIPPRLAPDIVRGTTYPLFVVNYHLPYLIAEPFMFVLGNATFAFKTVLTVTYILSAVLMFFALKRFGSNPASLTGAIVFAYLPYRFANLYYRGAIGECVALMFIPLVLLATNLIADRKRNALALTALSVFGLVTSHTVVFLMFVPFFYVYSIFFIKLNKKQALSTVMSYLFGIAMSSFQLLPSVFEKRFTKFDEVLSTIYSAQFINPFQLFRLPHNGVNLGTHLQAGIVSLVILILGLILIRTKNRERAFILIFLYLISIFLVSKQSFFLWNNIQFLQDFVYPWRFISLIIVISSFLAMFVVDAVRNIHLKIIFVICTIFVSIWTSRHYFLSTGVDREMDALPSLTAYNEADPIWSSSKSFGYKKEITTNNYTATNNYYSEPFYLTFDIENDSNTNVVIRRLYFPGWFLKINGQKTIPNISDGLISTNLLQSKNHIEVYFGKTNLRKFSDLLTLFAFLGIFIFQFYANKVKNFYEIKR